MKLGTETGSLTNHIYSRAPIKMTAGTNVYIRFAMGDHIEKGRIVKPRRGHEPPAGWHVVQFDTGGRMCVHGDMLALSNQ